MEYRNDIIAQPADPDYVQIAPVLKALGHPIRLEIAYLLFTTGELAAGIVAEDLEHHPAVISKHLTILREAGVIELHARQPQRFYTLSSPVARIILADLTPLPAPI